jgi:hypothetical protein
MEAAVRAVVNRIGYCEILAAAEYHCTATRPRTGENLWGRDRGLWGGGRDTIINVTLPVYSTACLDGSDCVHAAAACRVSLSPTHASFEYLQLKWVKKLKNTLRRFLLIPILRHTCLAA